MIKNSQQTRNRGNLLQADEEHYKIPVTIKHDSERLTAFPLRS